MYSSSLDITVVTDGVVVVVGVATRFEACLSSGGELRRDALRFLVLATVVMEMPRPGRCLGVAPNNGESGEMVRGEGEVVVGGELGGGDVRGVVGVVVGGGVVRGARGTGTGQLAAVVGWKR